MKQSTPHRPAAWLIAMLVIGLVAPALVSGQGPAVAAELKPASRTVGLYSYSGSGSNLTPARSFSGVLIDANRIATSTWALTHGSEQIGKSGEKISVIFVSVSTARGRQYSFPCRVPVIDPNSAITILAIADSVKSPAPRLLLDPLDVASLEISAESRIIGVIAPEMLAQDQISRQIVPAPIPMKLQTGPTAGSGAAAAASVVHPLPPSMIGGGVWNSSDSLVGILTRQDDALQVVNAGSIKALLPPKLVVTPLPPVPPIPTLPPPPTPPVVIPRPKPPSEAADPLTETEVAQLLKNLKPLLDRMRFAKLSLVIDPSLLDYVNQDQADLVMERIAGGKFTEALGTLDTIESLTTGTLAEQLNYRRALTLTLMGRFVDAKAKAQRAAGAADSLVRARGRALAKVLEDHPSNAYNGKPLSDSVTLSSLMRAAANAPDHGTTTTLPATVSDELRKSLETAFQAAKSKPLDNRASFDSIEQQLQTILKKINATKSPELEPLNKDITAFRTQILRREYDRTTNELMAMQQKYQEEFAMLQHRSGADWAVAGYLPDIHLARANAIIDNFNNGLRHLQTIGQQLNGEKLENPFKPLAPLAIAQRVEGR